MSDYNGWSNRETWLVNVWFEPVTKYDVSCAREEILGMTDKLDGFLSDYIDLSLINWTELEDSCSDTDAEGG